MADVKAIRSSLALSSAFVAWVLISLSTPVIHAEEHSMPSSYYLTITLVKSHLPEAIMKGKIRDRLFNDVHKAATLQIELDIGANGKYPYSSTTIARTIERKQRVGWAYLVARRTRT